MDENNKNEEFKVEVDKEELKNQTKDTVNQVKETVKNINFKKDASATKGFILELISKPFSTIESVVTEKENRFPNAVILMICYMVVSLVDYIVFLLCNSGKFEFMPAIVSIISPVIFLLAFTVGILLFGGKEKKNITTIISGITVAITPMIIMELLSIIYSVFVVALKAEVFGYVISILINTLYFITIALMFIAIKNLITKEDDDKMVRKVAIITIVAFVILEILSGLELYTGASYAQSFLASSLLARWF